eukprot:gb/GECG01008239.1/.p1 GENE.gb/GECG01008239.1/~~gb/GECG01008239.1/.p1  ORF type:complete len:1087 (+),score=226.14 gb/GECG01008239.1/:1-3261(+)
MAYMERRTRRCANHIIAAKQDEHTYLNHVSALGHVQPKVDNGPPPRMPHLRHNKKREAIQDERNFEIERENIILLNRMQDILRKPTDKKRSTAPFSMNIGVRRRELARITQENRAMLDRIQKARPAYSDKALREHSKRHNKLAKQVSEFATGRRGLGVETGRPATAVLSPIKEHPGTAKKPRPRSKSRGRQKRPQTAKPYRRQEGPIKRRPASAAMPRPRDNTDSKISSSDMEEGSPYITDNRAFGRRPPERESKRNRPLSAPTDFTQQHYQASKRAEEQDAGVVEDDSAESNDFERQVLMAQSGYSRPVTRGFEGSHETESRRYQRPVSAGSRRREQASEEQKADENVREPFIASAADGWKSEEEKKAFEEEFAREFSTSESTRKQPSRRNQDSQQSHSVRDDSNGSMKSEGGVSLGNDSFDQLSRFGAAPSAATEGSSGARPTSARRRGRPTSATGSRNGNEEGATIPGETSTRNEYVPPRTRSGERLKSSDDEEKAEDDDVAAMYSAEMYDASVEGEEFVNWNEASTDKVDKKENTASDSNMELSVTGNIAASGSRAVEELSPSNRPTNTDLSTSDGEDVTGEQQSGFTVEGDSSSPKQSLDLADNEMKNQSNEANECSMQEYDKLMSKMDAPNHVSGGADESKPESNNNTSDSGGTPIDSEQSPHGMENKTGQDDDGIESESKQILDTYVAPGEAPENERPGAENTAVDGAPADTEKGTERTRVEQPEMTETHATKDTADMKMPGERTQSPVAPTTPQESGHQTAGDLREVGNSDGQGSALQDDVADKDRADMRMAEEGSQSPVAATASQESGLQTDQDLEKEGASQDDAADKDKGTESSVATTTPKESGRQTDEDLGEGDNADRQGNTSPDDSADEDMTGEGSAKGTPSPVAAGTPQQSEHQTDEDHREESNAEGQGNALQDDAEETKINTEDTREPPTVTQAQDGDSGHHGNEAETENVAHKDEQPGSLHTQDEAEVTGEDTEETSSSQGNTRRQQRLESDTEHNGGGGEGRPQEARTRMGADSHETEVGHAHEFDDAMEAAATTDASVDAQEANNDIETSQKGESEEVQDDTTGVQPEQ